jgi:hypothetical protein
MPTHLVVDGSNLATEGRSLPSLDQLNRAVLDYKAENPSVEIIVIVDATFGHRIDASERPLFEDAIVHQELVAPPAGAIGRGDAFVLRIAEKIGATVLSNDSFQEFHAEHEWLFDPGRLVGGKPIPGVGWIFTPRTPVRGPKSREVTSHAKRKRKGGAVIAEAPQVSGAELVEKGKAAMGKLPKGARTQPKEAAAPEPAPKSGRDRDRGRRGEVDKAIAAATVEAVDPDLEGGGKRRKRRRKTAPVPAEPINVPGDFLRFVADHRPGDTIVATVEQFSSHGAFVECEGLRCYIPLTLMGTPAPRAAREVLGKGENREFIVRAYDAARRGIELMLPGVDAPIGPVTDDTVAAEVGEDAIEDEPKAAKPRRRKPAGTPAEPTAAAVVVEGVEAPPATGRGGRKRVVAPADMTPPVVDAPKGRAKKAAKKAAPIVEAAPEPSAAAAAGPRRNPRRGTAEAPADSADRAREAVVEVAAEEQSAPVAEPVKAATKAAKKVPAKRATAKKVPAEKAAAKKAPVEKAPVGKAAAKKVPAKKAPAKKAAEPVEVAAPVEKAAAKKAPAKKAAAKKVPAAKAAKKAPAKKAPAKKAAPPG